jgi:hypothetical protein
VITPIDTALCFTTVNSQEPDVDTGDEFTPVFDVARIDPTGDAVIAGRAAPSASVELLRNGYVHDRAVADRSGQFVMVPPRLPPGDSELTLRSRQPDGEWGSFSCARFWSFGADPGILSPPRNDQRQGAGADAAKRV